MGQDLTFSLWTSNPTWPTVVGEGGRGLNGVGYNTDQ